MGHKKLARAALAALVALLVGAGAVTALRFGDLSCALLKKTLSPATVSAKATTTATQERLCPACGSWRISESSRAALVGATVVMTENAITIPDCGAYTYKVTSRAVLPPSETDVSHTYQMVFDLDQTAQDVLCPFQTKTSLTLEMDVSGFNQDGSQVSAVLRDATRDRDILRFAGWNFDRENPGDSGTAMGASDMTRMENESLYKVFAAEVEASYARLATMDPPPSPDVEIPEVNPARFSVDLLLFCQDYEREEGDGPWAAVWARGCQFDRMLAKFNEFAQWQDCMDSHGNALSECTFPDGTFDRTPYSGSQD